MLQVPIRKVPAIFTVWSVITTAPIPTKWWHIEDNIRSWTVFLLQALKSLPPPNIVPPPAVVTMGSRLTITAENVNMQFWVCHKWKLTSTDIWMNRVAWHWCVAVICGVKCRCLTQSRVTALYKHWHNVMWETWPEQSQVDEVKIQFKVHFLTYYLNPASSVSAACAVNSELCNKPKFNVKRRPKNICISQTCITIDWSV